MSSFIGSKKTNPTDPTVRDLLIAELLKKDQSPDIGVVDNILDTFTSGLYRCPSSVKVGDFVYINNFDYVDKAASSIVAPAIGVVRNKPDTLFAIVQYAGEAEVFSGLTPGAIYFLSSNPGNMSKVAPFAPENIVQKVGYAKNTNILVLAPDKNFVIL